MDQDLRLTKHHLWWPKKHPAYQQEPGLTFRELPENIVELPWFIHQLIHKSRPPDPPSEEEMIAAIRKSLSKLIYERRKKRR